MKDITLNSSDDSIRVKLVYIIKFRFHRYGLGKSWPKHTQCLMFINDLLVGYGEVVKHANDEDNESYAIKAATAKVMPKLVFKDMRTELWNKILIALDEKH